MVSYFNSPLSTMFPPSHSVNAHAPSGRHHHPAAAQHSPAAAVAAVHAAQSAAYFQHGYPAAYHHSAATQGFGSGYPNLSDLNSNMYSQFPGSAFDVAPPSNANANAHMAASAPPSSSLGLAPATSSPSPWQVWQQQTSAYPDPASAAGDVRNSVSPYMGNPPNGEWPPPPPGSEQQRQQHQQQQSQQQPEVQNSHVTAGNGGGAEGGPTSSTSDSPLTPAGSEAGPTSGNGAGVPAESPGYHNSSPPSTPPPGQQPASQSNNPALQHYGTPTGEEGMFNTKFGVSPGAGSPSGNHLQFPQLPEFAGHSPMSPDATPITSSSTSSTRPQPARSPFEWMKKPSYQNQSEKNGKFIL